ncbi:hypothetical protein [Flavobacterium sp. 140616W15]|uniref:hypothetical protein n=1 Tax=Flavobacterium sp. 140616W15 TaxID=2478552 RepID=UPI000F0CB153|nr:hypothetical protein [Flavobacterium sp. 140616W15]AYN04936.1 hypothetical protein EAG11_12760 [Flavobacterium sp. 140616W15]
MDIKKTGRIFFYLHTTGNDSLKVTQGLSSIQAFFVLAVLAIFKKVLFPSLHITILFLFPFFVIISLTINYFNYKIYKKHIKDFTIEWNSETKKNKIIYNISNVVFVIFIFSICICILKYLDD